MSTNLLVFEYIVLVAVIIVVSGISFVANEVVSPRFLLISGHSSVLTRLRLDDVGDSLAFLDSGA